MVEFPKMQRVGQMMGWGDNDFYKGFDRNRMALMQGFAGLGADPMNPLGGFTQGFANGAMLDMANQKDAEEQAKEEQSRNATVEWLQSQGYDDLVQMAQATGDIGAAWSEGLKRSNPGAGDPFTLGAGDIRYDGYGNVIATGAEQSPQTVINNTMGATDEFYGQLDKNLATQTSDLINAGMNAQSNNIRLGQLETLLQTAPQGAQGVLVQAAGSVGIPVEGLDDVQAAEALISQMVPGQRPPGSGTMSDADLALFKRSLPSIINQPGGNQMILRTMRAINEYTIAQAEIAQRIANREITPAEGRALAMQVPNPLASFSPQGGAGSGLPPGVTIRELP